METKTQKFYREISNKDLILAKKESKDPRYRSYFTPARKRAVDREIKIRQYNGSLHRSIGKSRPRRNNPFSIPKFNFRF